jgi:hypothetical protein
MPSSPGPRYVANAFQFISVDAAIEALNIQRPVDSATLRKFMTDVTAQLAEQRASYSWRQSSVVSVGFCRTMCELLAETTDASLANLFLKDFMSNLETFDKKDDLAAALAVLARSFDWCDIGQALLGSLNKVDAASDNDFDFGSDEEAVEETDDTRMRLALGVVDGLDAGAAQQAVLKTAVENAAKLSQASLCSSKALGLLCKWAVQCGDKPIFDTVARTFEQTKPNLLKPVLDAFLESTGCHGAADERLSGVASIAAKRTEWLTSQLEALGKPFSWEMPDAYFPDNARVQAFLRGPNESMSTTGVRSFNGVGHARNYANKWMRGKQINASFKLEPEGRGQGALVVITKTRRWFSQHQKELLAYKSELRLLLERFGEGAGGGSRKRARLE